MKERLTIWCNNLFIPLAGAELDWFRKAIGEHDLHIFKPAEKGQDGESARLLNEADIAFGSPDPNAVLDSQKLTWVHLNTAGYTAYDDDTIKQALKARGTRLTNSSTVYDEPCAEHLLAMILSLARKLPHALDEQRLNKSWKIHEFRPRLNLLTGQTALIFGFGRIAERLVELLTPLRMKLIGVRREIKGDELVQIITEKEVNEYLPIADHIINILPDNAGTKNYFNAERLSKIKSTAIFYNIGRGTTVEQDVLRHLLETGKMAAAYLDVTNPEPLPPDNPLWTTPNCFITPHTAGGASDEKERQVAHFLENLRRFLNGEEMLDRIL